VPYAATFAASPEDLIVATTAFATLRAAVGAAPSVQRPGKGATQGSEAPLAAGRVAVRFMDAVIERLLAGNKPILTGCDLLRHAADGATVSAHVPVPAAMPSGTFTPSTTSPVVAAPGATPGWPAAPSAIPATPPATVSVAAAACHYSRPLALTPADASAPTGVPADPVLLY
jgi:hypothetical protein